MLSRLIGKARVIAIVYSDARISGEESGVIHGILSTLFISAQENRLLSTQRMNLFRFPLIAEVCYMGVHHDRLLN